MKFLHTADWQMGMRAGHVGKVAERVRAARLESARRVVELAKEHGAEFMLVAGDTFEDNGVDRVLVRQVADILGRFGKPVYLIAGNHDPLVRGSVWEESAWRSHYNLSVIEKWAPVDVPGGVLYPSPLTEKHSTRDPTAWMDAAKQQKIAIGLAHGTVEGVQQDELDYPIARDAAARASLDYLALGHWHSFASYPGGDGAVRMAYSGTHEQTKFGERDSGNVLLVEIAAPGAPPDITPLRSGRLAWRSIDERIAAPADLERVRGEIEGITGGEQTLLSVRLRGILHPEDQATLQAIEEIAEARMMYHRIDASALLPSPEDDAWISQMPAGVLKQVAGRLQELASPAFTGERGEGATPEVASKALLELFAAMNRGRA